MDKGERAAKRKAQEFYARLAGRLRCVVSLEENPSWHHLDELRPKNWTYENLIPLDQSLNSQLDKRRYLELPAKLRPAALEERSRERFAAGLFAEGYACARLGCFLADPPRLDVGIGTMPNPDSAIKFASLALLQLRPIAALELALDTLRRSVLPVLHSVRVEHVRRVTLARLALELGSYFRDYGNALTALTACDAAEKLLSGGLWADADGARELGLRAGQHRGIALAGLRRFNEAKDALEGSERAIRATGLYTEGLANSTLWTIRLELDAGTAEPGRALSLARAVKEGYRRRQASLWTYAEVVFTETEALRQEGRLAEANAGVEEAHRLFYSAGVSPTALLRPESVASFQRNYPTGMFATPRSPEALGDFGTEARAALVQLERFAYLGRTRLSSVQISLGDPARFRGQLAKGQPGPASGDGK